MDAKAKKSSGAAKRKRQKEKDEREAAALNHPGLKLMTMMMTKERRKEMIVVYWHPARRTTQQGVEHLIQPEPQAANPRRATPAAPPAVPAGPGRHHIPTPSLWPRTPHGCSSTRCLTLKTAQDVAGFVGKLRVQTKSSLKEVEKLIQLCLSLPVSAASSEREDILFSAPAKNLAEKYHDTAKANMALINTHSNILDDMDLNLPLESTNR